MTSLIQTYNEDCLVFLGKLKDKSVDVTFTSPPYNRKRNDKYANYDDTKENYFEWLTSVIDELLRVTKTHIFLNIQTNYYNRKDVYKIFGKYSDNIVENIIWEKTNPMPATGNNITNAVEYFIVFGNNPLKSNTTYTKNIISTSVNSKMPKNHKAVMKQDVSDYFHEKFMKKGFTVLDPFMGWGTTAISCLKYNMDFIGCEIVKDYFESANNNIKVFEELMNGKNTI